MQPQSLVVIATKGLQHRCRRVHLAAMAATLATQPGWKGLPAVRSGRVYIADGNAYYNRPGPRMVESIEMLAEILHPDTFADVAPTGSYIQV